MSKEDVEIEIKVPLSEDKFLEVMEKVSEIAEFQKKVKHVDRYFTPAHRNFVEPDHPFEWFSLRERGDRTTLTYKHFYPENSQDTTHCDEYEAELKDGDQFLKILSALDFEELVTVEKERRTYLFKDRFEVALDEVKELGYFIEIEAVKDLGTVEEIRGELQSFAERLGIDTSEEDHKGYPRNLMLDKGLL